jgi:hypothetical protein
MLRKLGRVKEFQACGPRAAPMARAGDYGWVTDKGGQDRHPRGDPWETCFRGWLSRCWSSSGRWPGSSCPRRRLASRAAHQRSRRPRPHRRPNQSHHPSRSRPHRQLHPPRHRQRRVRPHVRPPGRRPGPRPGRHQMRRRSVRQQRPPSQVPVQRPATVAARPRWTHVARVGHRGSCPCWSPRLLAEASW